VKQQPTKSADEILAVLGDDHVVDIERTVLFCDYLDDLVTVDPIEEF
jgi:hypothetical protein